MQVGMLSYACGKPAVLQGDAEGDGGIVRLYQPPATDVPEFALRRVCVCVCVCCVRKL